MKSVVDIIIFLSFPVCTHHDFENLERGLLDIISFSWKKAQSEQITKRHSVVTLDSDSKTYLYSQHVPSEQMFQSI